VSRYAPPSPWALATGARLALVASPPARCAAGEAADRNRLVAALDVPQSSGKNPCCKRRCSAGTWAESSGRGRTHPDHGLQQRRELHRQAGWLSIILGWLSHDLGDPLAAETHCVDAWEHGWQAEDGEICGWAMDTTATIAMYNSQPERARDAALKGLSQAPAGGPAAVRLACQRTRAYGRLGHAGRFDDALTDTRRQLDHLPQQGSGLFSADAGRIASYAATSSTWLSRADDAVRYAREALDFYARVDPAERSPTREAISRLDLGLALIARKTPDGAAEEVLRALNSERITGTVLARAGEVDAALQLSYPTLASTRNVYERYLALTYQQGNRPQLTT
jgi:hypothetical protein